MKHYDPKNVRLTFSFPGAEPIELSPVVDVAKELAKHLPEEERVLMLEGDHIEGIVGYDPGYGKSYGAMLFLAGQQIDPSRVVFLEGDYKHQRLTISEDAVRAWRVLKRYEQINALVNELILEGMW